MVTKFANTQSDFFQIVRIRTEVFVDEQKVDIHIEQDEHDDTALHWLVLDDHHQPVACCRGLVNNDEIQIGRVAVLQSCRHQGIATKMLKDIEHDPHLQGMKRIVVHAQIQVREFYDQLDYRVISEPFYEAGIRHVTMEKSL